MAERSSPVILCIDDYQPAIMVRKIILEQSGFRVLTATSGEEGLDVVKTQPVNLVLSDHFLQGKTGGEIAREMKVLKPQLPIVLLSGAIEMPEGAEYADAFVSKLDSRDKLIGVIEDLLDRGALPQSA